MRIIPRIQMLLVELRYAWQRAWRGYDDVDVRSFGPLFMERTLKILRIFRQRNIIQLPTFDQTGKITTFLSDDETNAVLDRMIRCFELADEDAVFELLWGKDWATHSLSFEEIKTVYEVRDRHAREALELFAKYCEHLWY